MAQRLILRGLSILIVEDDLLQTVDLVDSVEDAGGKITGPVFSVDAACLAIKDDTFDIAVVDYFLDGSPASLAIQQLYQQRIPFLVLSGYTDIPDLPQDWSGCRYMSKPADMDKLIITLAALAKWKRQVGKSHRVSADAKLDAV